MNNNDVNSLCEMNEKLICELKKLSNENTILKKNNSTCNSELSKLRDIIKKLQSQPTTNLNSQHLLLPKTYTSKNNLESCGKKDTVIVQRIMHNQLEHHFIEIPVTTFIMCLSPQELLNKLDSNPQFSTPENCYKTRITYSNGRYCDFYPSNDIDNHNPHNLTNNGFVHHKNKRIL